ncbi:MAG: hypothetical protein PHU04_05680 [Candidatus Peribacteraceae bacterium]|nr:hypothetical protein [Candidatus Peribacteraceae bacterium]
MMDLKSQIGKVYLGSVYQINISANLGRLLQAHGWKNKDEVFAEFDAETGEVRVSKSPKMLMTARAVSEKKKEKDGETEICFQTSEGYHSMMKRRPAPAVRMTPPEVLDAVRVRRDRKIIDENRGL